LPNKRRASTEKRDDHSNSNENVGRVTQVIGSTFDAEFPEDHCRRSTTRSRSSRSTRASRWNLTGEVQQHLGGGRVRCVALGSTDGMMRGQEVRRHRQAGDGAGRRGTLGRVFNVLGEPIDGRGPVHATERWPIHREAPPVNDLSTNTEVFETGIKVIDLLTPFVRGGKAGLFGGAGLGKTVILTELIARIASATAVTRCSPASASGPAKAPTCGWKCRKPRSATRAAA
jgi:F-type H+/Na+-transporting ATPase subunit beta